MSLAGVTVEGHIGEGVISNSVNISVFEQIERPPRVILGELFQIQGIDLDPNDIDVAVNKLVLAIQTRRVSNTQCNGINTFNCFISYRVRDDQVIAERIYDKLVSKGIFPFLDKVNLQVGYPWKEGFLRGLRNSECFLSLISRRALESCRDGSRNHAGDNVLLEIETALAHSRSTNNSSYIIPILIGEYDAHDALHKFRDFSPDLYASTVSGDIVQSTTSESDRLSTTSESDSITLTITTENADETITDPTNSEIVSIFHDFTQEVNAILGEAINDRERIDEIDLDGVYIELGEYKLIYSMQSFPQVSWVRYWHILPVAASAVHNLGRSKPSKREYISKSRGTSSYCILREQADREAVLDHLRRSFADTGSSIIRLRQE